MYDSEPEEELFLSDLLDQGRLEEAIELLRANLRELPDSPVLHSLLALCLEETGDAQAALDAAEAGADAGADEPFSLWVLGTLLADRRRYKAALRYAQRTLELSPHNPDHEALASQVLAGLNRWPEALEHAERGLALDPADEVCRNLRALCLRHTDGAEAAAEELELLSQQYAPTVWLREIQGWTALERGASLEAQQHFEQALELNPTSDLARSGLAEAIKSENPIYRRILRFFLWMERIPPRTRWLIILGGIFGYRRLATAVDANPALGIIAYPLMALWLGFIVLSWTSEPLSNWVLSRTVRGKPLVQGEQLLAANLVAGLLTTAVLLGLASVATGIGLLTVAAFVAAFQIIPTGAVFLCQRGWPQTTMAIYAGVTALAGLVGIVAPAEIADVALGVFIVLAVVGSWLGAFLATREPKA